MRCIKKPPPKWGLCAEQLKRSGAKTERFDHLGDAEGQLTCGWVIRINRERHPRNRNLSFHIKGGLVVDFSVLVLAADVEADSRTVLGLQEGRTKEAVGDVVLVAGEVKNASTREL